MLAFLKRIEAPTLLIMAKSTTLYDTNEETFKKMFDARVKSVRNIKLLWVEGGHHVHLDDAERVAPIIAEFLNSDALAKL